MNSTTTILTFTHKMKTNDNGQKHFETDSHKQAYCRYGIHKFNISLPTFIAQTDIGRGGQLNDHISTFGTATNVREILYGYHICMQSIFLC